MTKGVMQYLDQTPRLPRIRVIRVRLASCQGTALDHHGAVTGIKMRGGSFTAERVGRDSARSHGFHKDVWASRQGGRGVNPSRNEHTIAASCEICGRGYWSGKEVTVTIHPAAHGSGVRLVRTDLPIDRPGMRRHRRSFARTQICAPTWFAAKPGSKWSSI